MSDVAPHDYEILGSKISVIIAGFFGGVISMAFVENMPVSTRYLAVFSGVTCAMFFTPLVLRAWLFLGDFEPAVAFILGIGGMAIVGKIHSGFKNLDLIQLARNWLPNRDKTNKD